MTVQDDERERELCRLFNLQWEASHPRGETDANFEIEVTGTRYLIEAEVKSTTSSSISTARDVGLQHIKKWRNKFWVIGFYDSEGRRPELKYSLCLTPTDIEPWVAGLEAKILPDFEIAKRASHYLELQDLYAICGQKPAYTIEEAKKLHKMQWSAQQYKVALDIVVDDKQMISAAGMLKILRLRAKYIAERGATLNNPHISKSFLQRFSSAHVTSDWAATIRRIAMGYVGSASTHPFKAL